MQVCKNLLALQLMAPLGQMPSNEARLSVGSLQVYVDQRLRDAPPRYSRSPQAASTVYPATIYVNAGFVHDNSVPPPPYSEELKLETEPEPSRTNTVHM